ncbi:antitoxin [Candidatus Pacearchaeota archaeon CG10_big_fil_rev_8_21_14_0_10_32_14]|nr:MAG: antitoxin [Candidatus Pacearchaeota archaeon CG10_big_fil_rev_8_21_14_0_10_32_14]
MSKIISVSDEVYEVLTKLKGNKSYTVVIKSMMKENSNKERILSFAGCDIINKTEIEEIKKGWKGWKEKSY